MVTFGAHDGKILFKFVCLLSVLVFATAHNEFPNQKWTKDFAVEVESDSATVEKLAKKYGFKLVRKLPGLNVLHFHHPDACASKHRCKRHASDLVAFLKKSPGVKRVDQQFVLERDKRETNEWEELEDMTITEKDRIYRKRVIERHERIGFGFNDPLYEKQWHLDNFGQLDNPGLDMNVLPAWRKGYMGQNVNVIVIDDGVDTRHDDLKKNYDPLLSADLDFILDRHGNPASRGPVTPEDQSHGTSCAGEIAASANNGVCGVGVASKARLGGVRLLAGHVTDLQEAFAVLHQHNITDVYSCSWGPSDSGRKMEMPHYYTGKGIIMSATQGRNGLGTIFNYASGNGGRKNDNCGADGYTNSPYTLSIGSVNIYGHSVSYGERCSALTAVMPVGGWSAPDARINGRELPSRIITTDVNQKCNRKFLGTSAATPLGAACSALIIQANPKLTWRDVQHVVSRSCRIPNPMEQVWQRNGAGLHVSHHFGFGLLDCSKAVKVAQTWKNVGPRLNCSHKVFQGKEKIYINRQRRYLIRHAGTSGVGSDCKNVNYMEHATVEVKIDHARRGDIELWLISPMGTVSRLLGTREPDQSRNGISFTFLTRFTLGETSKGNWIFEVRDTGKHPTGSKIRGAVRMVTLNLFGTRKPAADLPSISRRARKMSPQEVESTFEEERTAALNIFPEHRDVLELKRSLVESEKRASALNKGLIEQAKSLLHNEFVSADEMKSVIKLLESLKQKAKN